MPVLPDWHRAWGEPLFTARIREAPSDFLVEEQLGIEFSGDGEHDYLHVRKSSANTDWVATRIARHAGARNVDVGYSGRKDRHAVTTQWFSVAVRGPVDWASFAEDGIEIFDVRRHRRKLRRGAHSGNRFRIALRSPGLESRVPDIGERLQRISRGGVPNYFGAQRFGRGAANLDLARRVFQGVRVSRNERNIAVSAARSLLFNEILSSRVAGETWNRILPGELANLDGSGSVFRVEEPDTTLERRCAEMDIHPTGALFGAGKDRATDTVADIECDAMSSHDEFTEGLARLNLEASRRALRLRVSDLDSRFENGALWLDFALPKGGFATTVLREIADCSE
jgi:tRNA pseudouridine13 synthase